VVELLRAVIESACAHARTETLRTEQAVRDYVEDVNSRVLEARRIPVDGPPIVIRTFDVDEVVETWRERR
jgi:hypothetical protein